MKFLHSITAYLLVSNLMHFLDAFQDHSFPFFNQPLKPETDAKE